MTGEVNLLAAFLGLKFLPQPLVIGSNSINPRLILHDEEFEYRIFFTTHKIKYTDVDLVDVYTRFNTANVCISRKDSVFTFSGKLISKARLIELVQFLKSKNCILTANATDLLNLH